MGSKLLVRSYNVGCGDCIYVRIPDDNDGFHMLIDCGSKEGANTGVMKRAIKHLEEHMLPDAEEAGKKRLDLIVVTHRHEDHIKGFNASFFKKIAVKNIWITAAMDESHEQAKKSNSLHQLAEQEMRFLMQSGTAFSPELRDLVALYGVNNKTATTVLTKTLPQKNGIKPRFVYAGQTSDDLDVKIKNTKLKVLAPEKNIDKYYLGKDVELRMQGMQEGRAQFQKQAQRARIKKPKNIGSRDFRKLQGRLLSNALAFAVDDSSIQNNVSTVILIEWGQRRLLFVGDAEWHNVYSEGKKNGSWNVMWKERKSDLSKPIDFLKVGHHGSHNATPWERDEEDSHEVNQIFNTILPLPKPGKKPTAQCVVSTKRKQYDTIPDAELLTELGKRVANTRNYLGDFLADDSQFDPETAIYNYSVLKTYAGSSAPKEVGDKGWLDKLQPPRTDMESAGKGSETMLEIVEFVDVEIDP